MCQQGACNGTSAQYTAHREANTFRIAARTVSERKRKTAQVNRACGCLLSPPSRSPMSPPKPQPSVTARPRLTHLVQIEDAVAEGRDEHAAGAVVVHRRQPRAALVEEVLLRQAPAASCAGLRD